MSVNPNSIKGSCGIRRVYFVRGIKRGMQFKVNIFDGTIMNNDVGYCCGMMEQTDWTNIEKKLHNALEEFVKEQQNKEKL